MTELLTRKSPITAVVCYNDYVAAGVLTALEKLQISVPNDISLMGFDNGLIAKYLHPKLSTMHYPIQIMAEQAAELSLTLAKGDNSDIKGKVFEAILIERWSVKNIHSSEHSSKHSPEKVNRLD